MSVTAKRLVSLILLVVFLMPSTGLMLYVHKCNMSNSTVYNTGEKEFCCSQNVSDGKNHHHAFDFLYHGAIKQASSLSALPCCENSGMFVKIGDAFVTQTISILSLLLPTFIFANTIYLPIDNLLTGNLILYDQSEYPPELPPYLKYSSLRI